MNDDEFAGIVGTALRERFPLPDDVDLLSHLNAPPPRRPRLRPMLAIAATVLVVASVAIVLAVRGATKHDRPASAHGLAGVTWVGADSYATLVFTADSVRISDGCANVVQQVTIGDGWLRIGKQIGKASVCAGKPPPFAVVRFDRVIFSRGELRWQHDGDTLRLTDAHGRTIVLSTDGTVLNIIGQRWRLTRYTDTHGSSHRGRFGRATLYIYEGVFRASDFCRELTGQAAVSAETVTFSHMRAGNRTCSDSASATVAAVVDHVLNGTVGYTIRGKQLVFFARGEVQLVYRATS